MLTQLSSTKSYVHSLFSLKGILNLLLSGWICMAPRLETAADGCLIWGQAATDRFSIDYSQGMVAGQVAIDTLTVGVPNITIADQAFGLTTNSTADFHSNTCDGVFVRSLPPFYVLCICHHLNVALLS